jgi:ribose transport system permease protein
MTAATEKSARTDLGVRVKESLKSTLWKAYAGENSGILIAIVIVTIGLFGFYLRDTNYLSADNLLSIVRQTAAITVMAVPTVFVIAARELDLSFAAVVPVSGFIAALLMESQGMPVAVAASLLVGIGVGLVNGLITVLFKIPSFVVTLGTMGILTGLSLRITNSAAVSVADSRFLAIFGIGSLGSVPSLLLWTVGVVAVGHFVLSYTATGRGVLATGANPNAARLSGIRTSRIRVGVMMASGFGGALAGLLYVGQFAAASYTLGTSDLLTVIAAVIIGGTSLAGGKGSVVGALIGSLLIGTLNNGLIIIGLANPEQLMVRGVIIIAAVIFSARTVTRRHRAVEREEPTGQATGASTGESVVARSPS